MTGRSKGTSILENGNVETGNESETETENERKILESLALSLGNSCDFPQYHSGGEDLEQVYFNN